MTLAKWLWAISSTLEPWISLAAWLLCARTFWRWWNHQPPPTKTG